MPTCQQCKKKWTWKQSFKNSFRINSGMKCPYCNETQYITTRFRKRSANLHILLPLSILIPVLFPVSPLMTLYILVGLTAIGLGIYPLFMELTNEEEPLW